VTHERVSRTTARRSRDRDEARGEKRRGHVRRRTCRRDGNGTVNARASAAAPEPAARAVGRRPISRMYRCLKSFS
jgi:hypothetical protein